ncbi:MAG: RNA 2',3'-cyclic phosphodiesterase, partial [Thermoplasmata archaeon]
MIRAFIAVEIHPTEEIVALNEKLRKTGCELKLVDLSQIHVTLRFLGNIDENQIEPIAGVIRRCASEKEFLVKLRGMGAFPNLNYINVIWIGISNPDELSRMASCINEKLKEIGFPEEDKPFAPHITLARVKSKKNLGELQKLIKENINMNFGDVKISAVILKKSELTQKGPV